MYVVCFCWKFENDLTIILVDMDPFHVLSYKYSLEKILGYSDSK